jgi:hypothetical protein
MKASAVATTFALALGLALVACSSAAPPPGPVSLHPQDTSTPPPVTTTPVPIVKAKVVQGAGRVDPFVSLFGPPTGASSTPRVAVSTFPNIPTLPGFENAPGAKGLWESVRLTGVMRNNGYTAIVEADGKSYFVRPGDRVDDKFTVISIGPDYITLGTQTEERHFSLGG